MTLHDDAAAMVLLDRAQQIRETIYGAGHTDTVRTLVNLAIFHQEKGTIPGRDNDMSGRWRWAKRSTALPTCPPSMF